MSSRAKRTKAQITADLVERLDRDFVGRPLNRKLLAEAREAVLRYLADLGLYPRQLEVTASDDGFIEVYADDYVPRETVN